MSAGGARPLPALPNLRELGRLGNPGLSVVDRSWDSDAGRPGSPLSGGLWRGAAEEKRKRFGRSGRIGETGKDCPAPPVPHLHGCDRRVPVGSRRKLSTITAPRRDVLLPFWTAITVPPEAAERPDVRGVVTAAARPPGRAPSGGQVDQSKADTPGAGHQSQSSSGKGAGPLAAAGWAVESSIRA